MFIAAVGILSVIAQTGLLTCLMKTLGSKHTIMVGLLFEMLQLMWYGFGSQTWMMWAAGILAAISRYYYVTQFASFRVAPNTSFHEFSSKLYRLRAHFISVSLTLQSAHLYQCKPTLISKG